MQGSVLGNAVKRVEDPRFIRGEGRYLDDLQVPGVLHVVPVRSPVAHGEIVSIDADEAAASPGVVGVYTAADLTIGDIRPGPLCAPSTARPVLARDRVRFVGEVVAVVVAETEVQANDAAELVWVDIEPLEAVVSPSAAEMDGAPLLFPELGTNVVIDKPADAVPGLLDDADVIVEVSFHNQRLAAVPLENNGALAIPEPDGTMTLWAGTQNIFGHLPIGRMIGLEKGRMTGRMPDMGGGFGPKFYTYPEQVLAAAVAHKTGRPAKWIETRRQNLVGMTHGRAQSQRAELGFKADGTIVGLRLDVTQDAGAYPLFGAYLPTWTKLMASGTYRIPKVEMSWHSVVTNTVPTHAYRGAGRPEATALLERSMDIAAGRLGIDPVELRRRNLIESDSFPYVTPTGAEYDVGDYEAALARALEIADYPALRAEQGERRASGSHLELGIGVAVYVEVTAPAGQNEWSRVEVHADGSATAWVGTSGHGQGHETAFAQIVGEALGIDYMNVAVVEGDTTQIPKGGGTGGSRSLQLGGSSVLRSTEEVIAKAKEIFAHAAEAPVEDIVVTDGGVQVAGVPDSHVGWGTLASMAANPDNLPEGMEAGLSFAGDFDQGKATYPFGAHVSVVEIDTVTGSIAVLRHVAVDDCGAILNRLLVDGQVHGGVAQGLGQALLEEVRYDEWANPLSVNLTSYLVPTAGTLPSIEIDHTETPTPLNPLGAKGIGESGTIGATAAVWNAVNDALAGRGVEHLDMPATPGRVWEALRAAQGTGR